MEKSLYKSKCVEFEVSGGLGNQILCLAAAINYSSERAISCRLNLGRYFDLNGLRREHPGHSFREYELSNFEIIGRNGFLSLANNNLKYVRRIHSLKRIRIYIQKILGTYLRTYYLSDGDTKKIPSSVQSPLLVWGNFLIFNNIERAVSFGLEKLTLQRKSNQFINFELMREPDVIVLHIRMGDYIKTYPELILGTNYYLSACQKLVSMGAAPKIYVFSDEPLLARDFFNSSEFTEFEIRFPEIENEFTSSEIFTYIRESKFIVGSCSTFSGVAIILGSQIAMAILPKKILNLFGPIENSRQDIFLMDL